MKERVAFFVATVLLVAIASCCAKANAQPLVQQAVNSPRGATCPAVLNGAPGLCFDAPSARAVVEAWLKREACEVTGVALAACQRKTADLAAAFSAKDRELLATSEKLGLLQKALDASQASGQKLESVISSLKWKVVLGIIGGVVVGGAVGAAAGYLLR